ncbi:MAG: hypothetical protein Unbinned3205contig1001_2 [Prokaryotic dsDNA virus sp.]|nr:MAG: hypothetical protein Unbinned3205contig1001_2 [Prokaryotic dsDNA virus sp.]|tara:strand:+ start:10170 stop:11900 length:1731 start_codon:yes stop_codon:yes gene_type:complete
MAEKVVIDVDFKTNAKETTTELDDLKAELEGIKEELAGVKEQEKATTSALGKLSKGFKGLGLGMKALGVGLIIEAFNFLKEILMQNQTVMDGISIATETLSVVFNQVTSVVTDVFEAVSKSSEGFEGLQKVIGGLMTIAITPLKLAFFGITLAVQEGQLAWENSFFGDGDPETIAQLNKKIGETKENLTEVIDDVVVAGEQIAENIGEAVTEIGNVVTIATEVATEGIKKISVTQALETGKAVALAKKNAELLEVLRAKEQLQSQLNAEIQRQIRDDVDKSFADRIKANEELGAILDKQLEKEKAGADEKVRIAKLVADTNKDSVEFQVAYQQALLEQIDIDERIAGQRSEQLTNQTALINEQKDAVNQLALIGKTERELELEQAEQNFEAQKVLAIKAGQDTVAITEEYESQIGAINKKYADIKLAEMSETIGQAGALFDEGTSASKVAGIAQATISTYQAMAGALAEPPFTMKNFVTAGIALATGLKSVKAIMSVKTKKAVSGTSPQQISTSGDAGGGGRDDSVSALGNLPSVEEQFNQDFQQAENTPIQAFVVEQQVTDSQQINSMIQQKATL